MRVAPEIVLTSEERSQLSRLLQSENAGTKLVHRAALFCWLPAECRTRALQRFTDGFMHPGEAIGHGVDIDEKRAARYPYKRAYLPVNRQTHDGTLVSW